MHELGLHQAVAESYRSIHDNYRIRGQYTRGTLDGQRSTGEPTTALCNLITNLQVHVDRVLEHKNEILMILMLGDDNAMIQTNFIDDSKLINHIKYKYNIKSKPANYINGG